MWENALRTSGKMLSVQYLSAGLVLFVWKGVPVMAAQSDEMEMELCGLEDFKITLEDNPELGAEAKWKLAKGWKLQEVERNTFILRLTKKQEAVQIARNGPWNICDGFLVVKSMPEGGKWTSADLNLSPIWVRVYEVPPRYRTLKNANALTKKIGTVISIDRMWRNGFPTNEYIRFQVNIQLNKPIMLGVFLPMEEGNDPNVWTMDMIGISSKDYFLNYEQYEQERLNKEIADAQFQAEARQNLILGEENFEPALIGTEIHMEAVVETSKREVEATPLPVTNGGQEAEPVLETAEEECGVVLAQNCTGVVSGPTTNSKKEDNINGIGEVDAQHVDHLAMVFKATLGSNSKSVHKQSRPIRPLKDGNVNTESRHPLNASIGSNMVGKSQKDREGISAEEGSQDVERKSGDITADVRSITENGTQKVDKEKEDFVDALRSLIRSANPDVIFLMKTKRSALDKEVIWLRLGFNNGVEVSAEGSSRGLALFWRQRWDVQVTNMDTNKIVAKFGGDRFLSDWVRCFTYAPPTREDRLNFWNDLGGFMGVLSTPWLVMCDLNSVLSANEKVGGRVVTRSEWEGLRNFIFNHGAIDLVGVGALFTWTNGQEAERLIWERLDCVIVSPDWLTQFKKAGVRNLAIRHSNHAPIILDTRMERENFNAPFRYRDAWSRDSDCRRIIENTWKSGVEGYHSFILCYKLKATAKALCEWNRLVFGHCQTKMKELEKLLSEVQNHPSLKENLELEGTIMLELDEEENRLESIWKQKSRENRLKEGDKNSQFFHASIVVRRKRNHIWAVRQDDGTTIEERPNIVEYFRSKFRMLFNSSNPSVDEEISEYILNSISEAENERLSACPTEEEIKRVVWSLPPLKSPGPDSFPVKFFKQYWDVVGMQVVNFVQEFFHNEIFCKEVNRTFIVLIPKKPQAERFDDYRPISLCNSTYKIVSEILANRLSTVLDKLISPQQAAFVKGRNIAKNSIIANEIVHDMKRRHCISSVSFQVLINGGITKKFFPRRGIRQGDPLSPLFFILCGEVLSRMFLAKEIEGALIGYPIGVDGQAITHLMYADDLVVFLKADCNNVASFKGVMDKYCRWSGQVINDQKSKLYFSKNCSDARRGEIMDYFGYDEMARGEKFLGNPFTTGGRGCSDFEFIVEKICSWLGYGGGIWATKTFIGEKSVWAIGRDSQVNVWGGNWSSMDGLICGPGDINPRRDSTCSRIWKAKLQERVKLFLWKLYHDALPFGCKLSSISSSIPGQCVLCGEDYGDTVKHFVAKCNVTSCLWFSSTWNIRIDNFHLNSGKDVVEWLLNPLSLMICRILNWRILFFMNVESIEAGGGIEVVRWGLLRPGRMKCFVDFAYAEDQGELEALSFGVSLVRHLAEVGADFYSDNLPLVSGLSEGRSPHWGIRFTFNKFCNDFDITRHFVVWISRVFNEATHTLAR
uniref:Reverse transcriptase domain-containing protein n=1 Tax=Cannabis sativa TaxID=3483 RepID=A0A803NUS3_CANSA